MQERRIETRMLCADLVDLTWRDRGGRMRRSVANLEDISLSGVCLQIDAPIPMGTELKISYPKGDLKGKVCYCVYREIGYFLGVEFLPGSRWSMRMFRPAHLLDPRRLVHRATARVPRLHSNQVQ